MANNDGRGRGVEREFSSVSILQIWGHEWGALVRDPRNCFLIGPVLGADVFFLRNLFSDNK